VIYNRGSINVAYKLYNLVLTKEISMKQKKILGIIGGLFEQKGYLQISVSTICCPENRKIANNKGKTQLWPGLKGTIRQTCIFGNTYISIEVNRP
jgi:hypothetical protein